MPPPVLVERGSEGYENGPAAATQASFYAATMMKGGRAGEGNRPGLAKKPYPYGTVRMC